MAHPIEEELARAWNAALKDPVDLDAIRSAVLALGGWAKSAAEKEAVANLENATNTRQVSMAVSAAVRVFFAGKPDQDGWPRS
jgi:hypothetical protein